MDNTPAPPPATDAPIALVESVPVAPFNSRSEFDEAVARAAEAARVYYDADALVMPDAVYDALVDRIAVTRALHPDWDDAGVTTEVAAGQSAGGDVPHPTPMLSLDKVADTQANQNAIDESGELNRFLDRAGKSGYTVEVKLDGNAIRAVYEQGRLVQAVTRGDGQAGEDVTANVLRTPGIHGLPATLDQPFTGEVRGEVFMTFADFDAASENRVEAGGKPFANPRNATAGCLRALNRSFEARMSFGAYQVEGWLPRADGNTTTTTMDSHYERMRFAADLGFTTAASLAPTEARVHASAVDAKLALVAIKAARDTLPFPIDGAVIAYNDQAARAAVGEGNRAPRWALAFKYPPREGVTTVEGVDLAIGRTGRLSLTLRLAPLYLDGSTVSRASGHNPAWLAASGLGVGMNVLLVKRGDIIPYASLLDGPQPADATPFVLPEVCPNCAEPWDKTSKLWRCHTPSCSRVGRVEWAASKKCWDIDGLSTARVEALVEADLVVDIADLFDLSVDQIAGVKMGVSETGADILIGPTVAATIVNGIEKAKTQPLARTIAALGLRFTGSTFGRRFAEHFKTLQAFRDATLEDLMQVEAVKEGRGTVIHAQLQEARATIDRLIAAGVTTEVETVAAPEGKSLPWVGKKVVVSGAVPGMGREEAKEAATRLGATIAGSVSKNTTLLVAGPGAGSKLAKAEALGVEVMDAEKFAALYAEVYG